MRESKEKREGYQKGRNRKRMGQRKEAEPRGRGIRGGGVRRGGASEEEGGAKRRGRSLSPRR
jgi:hypothetical protein